MIFHRVRKKNNVNKKSAGPRAVRGATLAEMLFCVLLLGFLSLIGIQAILVSFRISAGANDASYNLAVSDVLMGRVSGELENATKEIRINEDGSEVFFYNGEGAPVRLSLTEDGQLLESYETQETAEKAVQWTFDEAVYNNCRIENMTFTSVGSEKRDIIKIEMKVRLENGSVSEHTAYAHVKHGVAVV